MRASQLPALSRFLIRIAALLAALLAVSGLPVPALAAPANNIAAELVAEAPAAPGRPATVALHFQPGDGWHGYWSNPGDAGFGMLLDWDLPAGATAGEPFYPVPRTLLVGGLMNHVYEGDYAVLVPLRLPSDVKPGARLPISVKAQWLACTDKICVPEQGTLSTTLAIGQDRHDARFDRWRRALPPPLDSTAEAELATGKLRIAIPLPATLALGAPHVFIANDELVEYAAPQAFFRQGNVLIAELKARREATALPAKVQGILRFGTGEDGIRFAAQAGKVPAGGTPLDPEDAKVNLWLLFAAALAGGLMLNIMPCVFPILSLKALSLARAGETQAQARREGLAYTAGVVLACLALGGLLLALRAAGEEVGWAFQLQEPGVVVGLLFLAVAITANLAGLFYLPSLSVTRGGEPASAFATGLLAAFVATPCTGPFMAAALGAALLLPPAQALLLFAALGLGLALPFLALGFVPALRRLLPRPGAWMERFRRILAIPMGLTALALLWLVYRLGGTAYAAVAGLVALGLAIALWVVGRRQKRGLQALVPFAIVLAPFALFGAIALPPAFDPATKNEGGVLPAHEFSEAALSRARVTGRPVFVWFTADWCITCKVNENVAIEREATREAFRKARVIAIRGDWTRRDPAITRFLSEQGAAGVPLYLWYPANGEPVQLPQLLGPDSLIILAEGAARPGGTGSARP